MSTHQSPYLDPDDQKIAKDKARASARKDRWQPRGIGSYIEPWTKKNLRKKHRDLGPLLAQWSHILAGTPAETATPYKLTFPQGRQAPATLHLETSGAFALLIQAQSLAIVERINTAMGYQMIDRIVLKHR